MLLDVAWTVLPHKVPLKYHHRLRLIQFSDVLLQSSLDIWCAFGALLLCTCVCYLITAAMSRETE